MSLLFREKIVKIMRIQRKTFKKKEIQFINLLNHQLSQSLLKIINTIKNSFYIFVESQSFKNIVIHVTINEHKTNFIVKEKLFEIMNQRNSIFNLNIIT